MSPLLAPPELLHKLPPAYVEVCSADPLGPEGAAYAKKLEESGVLVKLFVLEGIPHGGHMLFVHAEFSKAARKAFNEEIVKMLK